MCRCISRRDRCAAWTVACALFGVLAVTAACSGGDDAEPATTSSSSRSSSTTVVSPVELAGTSWRLSSIERDGETIDAASDVPAVVSFGQDELEAYDGVNTASGSYGVDGDELTVDALFTTEIATTGPALPQYELFGFLEQGGSVEIDSAADTLRLELADATTLVFERGAGGVPD